MGDIKKIDKKYSVTETGAGVLKNFFSGVVNLALDYGLVNGIKLATTPEINVGKEGDDYYLSFKHYGEYDDVEVKVSLGDNREDIVSNLEMLVKILIEMLG
jgi:hypothetical protein